MSADTEYLDLYEAAAELGISMATMWSLLKRHNIVRYKLPGKRRAMIRRSDLEQLRQPIPMGEPRRGRPRGSTGEQAAKRAA